MNRIPAPDILRGLIMVIMALDHTRDLLHVNAMSMDPTDLNSTTPALFFTRWITHLCAPGFVCLAGMSAFLALENAADKQAARTLMLKRGLWLMVLEMTVINFGIWFDPGFHTLLFQVIFAIGFGLVVVSQLSRLSPGVLGAAGLVIMAGHALVPALSADSQAALRFVHSLFFKFGFFQLSENRVAMILYPVIPWLGIMLFGFACGPVYRRDSAVRQRLLFQLGAASLLVFIVLRTWNWYGDPRPWGPRPDGLFSFMSFINASKYPPSLLFCAITLGINFILLALFEKWRNKATDILMVYGKVPLFYYMVHWYIIHSVMMVLLFANGVAFDTGPMKFGRPASGFGLSLPQVYLAWALIVASLYPLCRWFGRYKHANSAAKWWLKYI